MREIAICEDKRGGTRRPDACYRRCGGARAGWRHYPKCDLGNGSFTGIPTRNPRIQVSGRAGRAMRKPLDCNHFISLCTILLERSADGRHVLSRTAASLHGFGSSTGPAKGSGSPPVRHLGAETGFPHRKMRNDALVHLRSGCILQGWVSGMPRPIIAAFSHRGRFPCASSIVSCQSSSSSWLFPT